MFGKEILIKEVSVLKPGDLRHFAEDLKNRSRNEILKKRLGGLLLYLEI
jgi:hypothetical protein